MTQCAKLTHAANDTVCKIDTIAPHIHVLYRDIPFILNITIRPEYKNPAYRGGVKVGLGLGEVTDTVAR